MVDPVRIKPEKIRGWGNILDPKTVDDFTVNDGVLSESLDTVNEVETPVITITKNNDNGGA